MLKERGRLKRNFGSSLISPPIVPSYCQGIKWCKYCFFCSICKMCIFHPDYRYISFISKVDSYDWDTSAFVISVSELLGRFIREGYIAPVYFVSKKEKYANKKKRISIKMNMIIPILLFSLSYCGVLCPLPFFFFVHFICNIIYLLRR